MTAPQIVNEKTTIWVTVAFQDRTGVATTPSSATYRIDCLTSGAAILASTAVSGLSSSTEIEVTSAQNAIQVSANPEEFRRMTVTANYGTGDVMVEEFDWIVKNLPFAS